MGPLAGVRDLLSPRSSRCVVYAWSKREVYLNEVFSFKPFIGLCCPSISTAGLWHVMWNSFLNIYEILNDYFPRVRYKYLQKLQTRRWQVCVIVRCSLIITADVFYLCCQSSSAADASLSLVQYSSLSGASLLCITYNITGVILPFNRLSTGPNFEHDPSYSEAKVLAAVKTPIEKITKLRCKLYCYLLTTTRDLVHMDLDILESSKNRLL